MVTTSPPTPGRVRPRALASTWLALASGLALAALTASASLFDLERTSIKEGVLGVSFTTSSADNCVQTTYSITVGEKGRRERSTDPVPALPLLPLASIGPDPPTTPSASPEFRPFFVISITTYDSCRYLNTYQVVDLYQADPADLGLQTLQLSPSTAQAMVTGAIAATACGQPLLCPVESGAGCEPLCTLVEVTINVAASCPTRPQLYRTGSSNAFPDGSATRTSAVGTSCQNAFPPEPPYLTIKVDGQPLTGVTAASAYFGNYGTASFSRTAPAVEASAPLPDGFSSSQVEAVSTSAKLPVTRDPAAAGRPVTPVITSTFFQGGFLEASFTYTDDSGCTRTISISAGESFFRFDDQTSSGGMPLISPVVSLAPDPEPARPSAASASSAPFRGASLSVSITGDGFCSPLFQFGSVSANSTKELGFSAFTITPSASRARVVGAATVTACSDDPTDCTVVGLTFDLLLNCPDQPAVLTTRNVFYNPDGSVERSRFTGKFCTNSFDPTAVIAVAINGEPLSGVTFASGSFGHILNAVSTRTPPAT